MTFATLGLDPRLVDALTTANLTEPTQVQSDTIPVILAGKDVMVGAQTGTGKTAAFSLPILHQLLQSPADNIRMLVLTPTRELAQQVYANIRTYAANTSLKVIQAYGGVSLTPQIQALSQGCDILIATPGRLLDLMFKQVVDFSGLAYLVFDEADRMLDMGFKDEINRVLRRLPAQRQTLLFSATLDDSIFALSKRLLNQPEVIEVHARNSTVSTVEQIVYQVDADRKRELVSYLIGARNWHQVLLFSRTKQGADALAKEMSKDGIPSDSIHGDKSQGARDRALENFKSGKIRALIATDVASRGIDIPELEYVINVDLPYQAEDYIHRIGRTGRAGKSGMAISLLSPDENWLLEEIETLLKSRLPQQWLAGFEPDLNKPAVSNRRDSNSAQRRRAKSRAMGNASGNKRRRNKPNSPR